jgi:Holliday junction resolvasome RuvABC endonuclease subunit
MKILAIDQSYTSTGIIILDEDRIEHVEIFKTKKELLIFTRAHNITTHILSLVKHYEPDIIAIEGLAFGMRGNATRDLAGLQFAIITVIQEQYGYTIDILAPLTVKKFATGSGKAKKMEMFNALPQEVKDLFVGKGWKKTTGLSDATDAYWIGKTIQHRIRT